MTVHESASEWLDEQVAAGKLASTLHNYRWAIDGILLPWCEREGIVAPADLTQQALNRLATELHQRKGRRGEPISRFTVASYLGPIRYFLDWLGQDGTGRPRLPSLAKKGRPKDVLTRTQIQAMEDACASERDKLIVRVLGDTGMRIGELVKLRPENLLERNRQWFLYVHGKALNNRFVQVPRVWRRLQRWVDRGRRQPCADAMFTVVRHQNGYYPGIKYSGAYEVVKNAAEMAGIDRSKVHPHLLRHSFITHLRRKGCNDAQISLVVGNWTKLDSYTWMEAGDFDLMAKLVDD